MHTGVCDMLGIEFPIFAFSHCRDVVAAVTNAGGFGVLGAVAHSPDSLDIDLAWIDEQTRGRPYGVDLLLPVNFADTSQQAPRDPASQAGTPGGLFPAGHLAFVEDLLDLLGEGDPFGAPVYVRAFASGNRVTGTRARRR